MTIGTELLELAEKHARMCDDFERMGTGQFRDKYPDYQLRNDDGHGPEGVHYITRHARKLVNSIRTRTASSREA